MKVQPLINCWNGYDTYTIRLALLLVPILLKRVKIPCNKGRHYPFHKSQLDSRMIGGRLDEIMHPLPSNCVVWCALKLKNNKRSELSESKLF